MREIRSNEQINSSNESRLVEGYAIVFESESKDLGGFTEVISRNAISQETLDKSDILFLLDHNKERGILARSKYGNGSLKLELDNIGLKFSFDAPETSLGDEILIGLRRKDISQYSFAFTVEEDRWEKRNDGSVLRTIENIDELFDLSIVYNPAYDSTIVVNKRGLDELMKEEEIRNQEEEKDVKETEVIEAEKEEEKEVECKSEEENNEKETSEENEDNKENKSDEESEENKEEDKEEEERKNNETNLYLQRENKRNHKFMAKFSLVNAINSVVNNRAFDDVTLNVIKEGREIANRSGISMNGQIVLPVEYRAEGDAEAPVKPVNGIMATEPTIGQEIVPTDLWNIEGALRDKMVLAQAGAQFITASSNIEIPVYDGNSVYWESEIGMAQDGSGKFSKVTLSPKRLTAFVDISKMLLNQTSGTVESMLREDLINAVAEKLQKTILGNGKGSDVEPKGIFNDVTADSAAFAYNDAVDMEAALESANVYGDFSYIVNPNSKAALRVLPVDKGSGRFVYENNEILGINAYSTNSVVNKGVVLGDFKQMVIANFGAMDLTVDTVSRAAYGQIRLVVNFYVDYAVKRPEAFVKRILK